MEDIKKRINKDVLKRLNMTDEEFQRLVKAYEQTHPQNTSPVAPGDKLAAPTHDKALINSQKVRKVDPGENKAGNLQRGAKPLPPPEFRDAEREFKRLISELPQTQPKK